MVNEDNFPGWMIAGENIHKYMLRQIENLTHITVPVCYGVARRADCSWTPYGTWGCHALKVPFLWDTHPAKEFFHAHEHCRSKE